MLLCVQSMSCDRCAAAFCAACGHAHVPTAAAPRMGRTGGRAAAGDSDVVDVDEDSQQAAGRRSAATAGVTAESSESAHGATCRFARIHAVACVVENLRRVHTRLPTDVPGVPPLSLDSASK
jgi:hypothetical protein